MITSDPWPTIPPASTDVHYQGQGCLTLTEIDDLVHARLVPQVGIRLEQHLFTCARCRDEVEDRRDFENIRRGFQATTMQHPVPPEVPNHIVEAWIGGGGQGEVWRGHYPPLDQPRAFKVLRAELDSQALHLMRREARIMAALGAHANRVQVFDLIDRPEGPVLVMAYVNGGALNRQAPMHWERALRYVVGVAEGLRELHAAGLLHRDIKPSNLLLDRARDVAVLGDYGLAAAADGRAGLAGTSGYLAPELLAEPPSVKSDVFALAATLYHLVTGAPPFAIRDPYNSLREARDGLPRPAVALSQFPRGVEEVIRAGLEPIPGQRADLDKFLALLKIAHNRELADVLRRLADRSTCPVRLDVAISTTKPQSTGFQRVLSCSNRDPRAQTEGVLPVAPVSSGDWLRIEVTADVPGHLTILDFDTASELSILPPGPLAGNKHVETGVPYELDIQMTPAPAGDYLAVIWTRRPTVLAPAVWRERIAAGQVTVPDKGMDYLHHESNNRLDDWAAVMVEISQSGPKG